LIHEAAYLKRNESMSTENASAEPIREPDSEPCDICLSSGGMVPLVEISLHGAVSAWVHRCGICGFRQIRPRLTRGTLSRIYPAEYFDSASAVMGYSDFSRQAQRYRRAAYFLAKKIRRLVPPRGKILEAGCALGFLLQALREYTSFEVRGLDVSPFASYFAGRMYGMDVDCGTLQEAGYRDGAFDFIIQKDLLEHVLNPREHMAESNRILRKGGYLWLITPNGEANVRPLERAAARLSREAGRDELPLIGQGHLSYFSKEHLIRLFSDTGFECVSVRSISIRRGLRALGIFPFRGATSATIARSAISRPSPEKPSGGSEACFGRLFDQISGEIKESRRPFRNRTPYFYWRQIFEALDRLPGWLPAGLDFEFLLRKR
jgi:SAM-dependent methyltransferase